MKAAIYARYSEGRTVEEQLTVCERLARKSGYKVANPCDEVAKKAAERSPKSKKGNSRGNRDRFL